LANKGYCFVNVTSPDAAFRLWKYLHGYRWKVSGSRKVCEIDYADIQVRLRSLPSSFLDPPLPESWPVSKVHLLVVLLQGREDLVARFSRWCFDCDTEDFLPVWFSPPRNGVRPAVFERHVVGRLRRR
jgi:hypothetical protein